MSKTCIFSFIVGAAVGSLVTWKLVKTTYEKVADTEINEMREWYNSKICEKEEPEEVSSKPKKAETIRYSQPDLFEYAKIIGENNYKEVNDVNYTTPYIIPPDDFGENDDYECESLTYYADGVLTDESGNVIDDTESLVGPDFESHFGEYEDDSVFVRNEKEKTDYEILRDLRNFSDCSPAN